MCAKPVKETLDKIDNIVTILKRENKKYIVPIVTIVSMTKSPFMVLISCILSLRTKDKVTAEASNRLFKLADNPQKMLGLSIKNIEKAIYPVGFYKTKAKRIKEICRVLLDDYEGVVPNEIDELLKLNGVGRKTANLTVTLGYGKLGICVDTHVHRISNRLGLVKTKTPEQTEFALRKKLPQKHWLIYNDLLVTYGQNLCVPISPWCSKCKIFKYCKRVGVKKSR
ncbi:MAG: endonuclease III [Candidatus Scalindua sp.]|nr:endonuclease III [Candidatus Scalindua sp.]